MSSITDKIAVGTVQFGLDYGISNKKGKTSLEEVEKIISYAKSKSINTLDTARAYGSAENVLGSINVNLFQIVSKFILENDKINDLLNNTLNNLSQKSIYGYLYHSPLEVLKGNSWQKLQSLKKDNKIEKIGFSFNTLDEANSVLDKGFIPDLIQIPFNVFDDRFKEIAIELKQNYQTEIHSRSTFLQGLFFLKNNELDGFFKPIKKIVLSLQEKYNDNLAGILLNYAVKQNYIDKTVIGVNNYQQLECNVNSLLSMGLNQDLSHIKIDEKYIIPSLWKV